MSDPTLEAYMKKRENLVVHEQSKSLGWRQQLDDREEAVNKILMKLKCKEFDNGYANPRNFLASQHFFRSRLEIEKSDVFKFIQKLPKGASLHSHDTALVSEEYLYSLTFRDNLYCHKDNDVFRLQFFNSDSVSSEWISVKDLREKDSSFDTYLRSKLTLIVDDPNDCYPTSSDAWKAFKNIFSCIAGLVKYKPIWQEYFYQALKELYEDNVRYLEFRGVLPNLYDLDGKIYSPIEVVGLYYDTLNHFMSDYPEFYGAKFIYAPPRYVDNCTMDKWVEIFKAIQQAYPDFVVGFDLVGEEDNGEPLISFLPQLLELKKNGTRFYFHAGETNWQGCSIDSNLVDALLLNTKRIGHGLAVIKHPEILKIIKENQIAIEICPISNQVLHLVSDVRNHPGCYLIANDYPVVIAPDDPSFWGAKALSYDWYIAFMGMTAKNDDLRLLKQLAINSLEYSSMPDCQKKTAMVQWQRSWHAFIDEVIKNNNCAEAK